MSSDPNLLQIPSSPTLLLAPSLRLPRGLLSLLGLAVAAAGLFFAYGESMTPVTVRIDGQTRQIRTHRPTVGALVAEAGIRLAPADYIVPPLTAHVTPGMVVEVHRSRQVELEVDGQTRVHHTLGTSAAAVLVESGVQLGQQDQVLVNDRLVQDPALPFSAVTAGSAHGLNSPGVPGAIHVRVQRAISLQVVVDGLPMTVWTTATTVGAALEAAELPVYAADRISLPLDTPISPGLQVILSRSRPVMIVADGWSISTRTRLQTVGQVLAQEGIQLAGKDYTLPGAETVVAAGATIQVVRVKQEFLVEEEKIAYESFWRPSPDLEIDQYGLAQAGAAGVKKRRIRKDYENGAEIRQELEQEWIDTEPAPEIWHYGTKIVIRTLDTPEGPIQYWRKLRMHATAYTAATSGKSPDHPAYGITRVGWRATRGVIAVDPRVVNLFSRMYVPGYGLGTAADTGGLVRGMRIDLAYDEDKLEGWYRWVDVYLVAPPPPERLIRYRLPGSPAGRATQ